MKIFCKLGEPRWCSFPLRALTPKNLSTHGDVVNAKPSFHRMPLVDTIMNNLVVVLLKSSKYEAFYRDFNKVLDFPVSLNWLIFLHRFSPSISYF